MDFKEIIGAAIISEGIYEEIKDTVKETATKLSNTVGVSKEDALIQGAVSLTVQKMLSAINEDDDEDDENECECCHCSSNKPSDDSGSAEDYSNARAALAALLGL